MPSRPDIAGTALHRPPSTSVVQRRIGVGNTTPTKRPVIGPICRPIETMRSYVAWPFAAETTTMRRPIATCFGHATSERTDPRER